jgi:hypothetical protein
MYNLIRVIREISMNTRFNNWIDTLVEEKNVDLEECFEVEGPSGTNTIPYGVIIEHIKIAPTSEQRKIKDVWCKDLELVDEDTITKYSDCVNYINLDLSIDSNGGYSILPTTS